MSLTAERETTVSVADVNGREATVELRPMGTFSYLAVLDGATIGSGYGTSGSFTTRTRGEQTYRFPDETAAVAAMVSNRRYGYWTGEC